MLEGVREMGHTTRRREAARAGRAGTLVILSALNLECQAVRSRLTPVGAITHPAGTRFEVGALPGCSMPIATAALEVGKRRMSYCSWLDT